MGSAEGLISAADSNPLFCSAGYNMVYLRDDRPMEHTFGWDSWHD